MSSLKNCIEELPFSSRFTSELPADPETRNFPRQVLGACYSITYPTLAPAPRLLACSVEMLDALGLHHDAIQSASFTEVLSGNVLLPNTTPYASCYGGHQFGYWAGQLGDGRAINLGETRSTSGQYLTLQLKGAGRTPYSRSADGLAVLRSSVREFLCSEAMHHLGVPTTRALSLVATGQGVIRDMLYDGHPKTEPGAIVCRVAPSFTRFGHFEIFTARGEIDILRKLADFTLRHDFPEIDAPPSPQTYAIWFEKVCRATAKMVLHWQRVGFVHGVMNTDNMSILGLTIDYGPYGWVDNYDPDWTPNTTDAAGRRYRFGQQAQVAYWNLVKLANALYPLIQKNSLLEAGLTAFTIAYEEGWRDMMAAKLGLECYKPAQDDAMTQELLAILPLIETDMTLFYRHLSRIGPQLAEADDETLIAQLEDAWYQPEQMTPEYRQRLVRWLRAYILRLRSDHIAEEKRIARMHSVNPRYVLRNYLAQQTIDRITEGDTTPLYELLDVLRTPYTDQPGKEGFSEKRPDWARNRPGCSMLSCSS